MGRRNQKESKNETTFNTNTLEKALNKMTNSRNEEKKYDLFEYPLADNVKLQALVGNDWEMFKILLLEKISINISFVNCKDGITRCMTPSKKYKDKYYNEVFLPKELAELSVEIYKEEFAK